MPGNISFSDIELKTARSSRHALLREVGELGTQRIASLRVLILGAGGVGCPIALYLAEAGIAHITIADCDTVEPSNLARQILHTAKRIGINKAISAKIELEHLNDAVDVRAIPNRVNEEEIAALAQPCDLIVDCTDNFKTRHAANRAALRCRKPLITASAIRYSIQVAFFDFTQENSPCYACAFPEDDGSDVKASNVGVLAPASGIAGMIAAEEALKWAAGIRTLASSLLVLDTLSWEMQRITLAKMPDCACCSCRAKHTTNEAVPNKA